MIETRPLNIEPLNFERFRYEPLEYKYAGRTFDELPSSAKVYLWRGYLSPQKSKCVTLASLREERIKELKEIIHNTQVAIVGGLIQIHLPEEPATQAWVDELEKVIGRDLMQEYVTALDDFVEDFDALVWASLKNRESLDGGPLSVEEQVRYREEELAPHLDEVYTSLVQMWGEAHREHFLRRARREFEGRN